jgi:hypothetical protein
MAVGPFLTPITLLIYQPTRRHILEDVNLLFILKLTLTVGIATTLRSGRPRDRCSIPGVVNNFIYSPTFATSYLAALCTEVKLAGACISPDTSTQTQYISPYLVTCSFLKLTQPIAC